MRSRRSKTPMKLNSRQLGPRGGFLSDPLTWTIKKRLERETNTMCAWIGDLGSGKSTSNSTTGENVTVTGEFRARDISFLPMDYIYAINHATAGQYKQFDEPGAEWGARNFMTVENKMLNATHITFRSKQINVGWSVPVLKMQDITSRMLIKYVFTMRETGPKGMSRFYKNWVDHYSGKTGRTRLGTIWFAKAWQDRPEEEKEYLEMKRQYQDSSYEKYYKEFAKMDDENKDKVKEAQDAVDKAIAAVTKNPTAYLNSKGKVDRDYLRREFRELTTADARYVADLMSKRIQNNNTGI